MVYHRYVIYSIIIRRQYFCCLYRNIFKPFSIVISFSWELFSTPLLSLPGAEWEVVLLHRRVSAATRHAVWARGRGGGRQSPQSHPAVAQTPQWLLQQGGSDSLLQQPPDILAGVNRSHKVRGEKHSRGYDNMCYFVAFYLKTKIGDKVLGCKSCFKRV